MGSSTVEARLFPVRLFLLFADFGWRVRAWGFDQ